MHTEETDKVLDEVSFVQMIKPIIIQALSKEVPYCTAVIWVANASQKTAGESLTQEIADELGPDKCLREATRILFIDLSTLTTGTLSWFINFLNPDFFNSCPKDQRPIPIIHEVPKQD